MIIFPTLLSYALCNNHFSVKNTGFYGYTQARACVWICMHVCDSVCMYVLTYTYNNYVLSVGNCTRHYILFLAASYTLYATYT